MNAVVQEYILARGGQIQQRGGGGAGGGSSGGGSRADGQRGGGGGGGEGEELWGGRDHLGVSMAREVALHKTPAYHAGND